jgi:hypothetical protein
VTFNVADNLTTKLVRTGADNATMRLLKTLHETGIPLAKVDSAVVRQQVPAEAPWPDATEPLA